MNNPSVMINLIGSDANYDWLKLPLVHLHWYDKEVRPGRKVGHLNLTDSDTSRLTATLEALIPLLPPEYASGVIWAQSKFGWLRLYSCRMRRNAESGVPIRYRLRLIRNALKHRIRHCAPIAGCGTGCRPDKTRQASHQTNV